MTRNRWLESPNAVDEAERIYAFVGKFVVSFQWLESKVDEMIILARGDKNRSATLNWLEKKTNQKKIDEFQKLVTNGSNFRKVEVDGWYDHFNRTIDALQAERKRRNDIVHAQFLFDFLAIGGPVLKSIPRKLNGHITFEQDSLSPKRCDIILQELADLSFTLNQVCVQLVHVYKSPDEQA